MLPNSVSALQQAVIASITSKTRFVEQWVGRQVYLFIYFDRASIYDTLKAFSAKQPLTRSGTFAASVNYFIFGADFVRLCIPKG